MSARSAAGCRSRLVPSRLIVRDVETEALTAPPVGLVAELLALTRRWPRLQRWDAAVKPCTASSTRRVSRGSGHRETVGSAAIPESSEGR
jgi:hypothetical protein